MQKYWFRVLVITVSLCLAPIRTAAGQEAEDAILQMLAEQRPFHAVSEQMFEQLGWDLPDGGGAVKALADAASGGAFDPRKLESLPPNRLGYRAKWHEVRYPVYGLDWDIPGLHLIPNNPLPNAPTMVIINGGSANWYEFYVDPLNGPGLGQYLAQRIPVLLVTIPGNYRHGGWTQKPYEDRIPGYLLDRDVSSEEVKIRNAVYTFQVVADGVEKIIDSVTTGPVVIVGHSTGGEIQFILKNSGLRNRLLDYSMGWGTGAPAGMDSMREMWGTRTADRYRHVSEIRPRLASGYAGAYLGPLNPIWNPNDSREVVAERWMGHEEQRRPQFKQTLQDMEHNAADNLREHAAVQVRETLQGNKLGIDPDEVIADLFTTTRAPLTEYRRMIFTVAKLDEGHWNSDPAQAKELQAAIEFREKNPDAEIRVLVFDLPMTHYGHIEKPRQLAGGLLAALRWLFEF